MCKQVSKSIYLTRKQYEQLCVKPYEGELVSLYYLPKAHKIGTPLQPTVFGLKHPTIEIFKPFDGSIRSLFDRMARETLVNSGFELFQLLEEWAVLNMHQETVLCTVDVVDLYSMIPQIEGVLSLKKMLDHLKLKRISGLKAETVIRLRRFVVKNNYFSYDGQYYHHLRGGAMGSINSDNC